MAPYSSTQRSSYGTTTRKGDVVVHTSSGSEIYRGSNGQVHVVHTRDLEIQHGPGGSRTVTRERSGHVVVVTNGYGHGYVQHPYSYRGTQLVSRSYYVNGVAYARVYRPYVYYGVPLVVYTPTVYYEPAFYGWTYNPWGVSISYNWGWSAYPWYAYYGPYFTPYPVYSSASLWLTDYLISQTLQAAYQERAAELASAQAEVVTPMALEVKQAIADEVRLQLALENAEAGSGGNALPDPGSSGIARMLGDNSTHVFVVSAPLDVNSDAGECPLTEGDVLQLPLGTPPNATSLNLVVMASKGRNCRQGSWVTVGVADLQDMHNHMRETIDQGMGDLQAKQGQNGIPAAPANAMKPPVRTAFAALAPPPDPSVATELSAQAREAEQAEQEALKQPDSSLGSTAVPPLGAPGPRVLSLGQSLEEVAAIRGQPKEIVDLGPKKIYIYNDLKVTFIHGKVTDVQ